MLQFLATIAFVEIGPKGSKSKLVPVKLLAASEVEFSEELRSFAVARVASLATDRLPCAAVATAQQGEAADGEDIKEETQATEDSKPGKGKNKTKRRPKQQYQAHACLVDEVWLEAILGWCYTDTPVLGLCVN